MWRALGDGDWNDPEAKLQAMLRCGESPCAYMFDAVHLQVMLPPG